MTFPTPAQRRDWWSNNFETWLPTDADERAEHLAELAHEAEHGPADPTDIYATTEPTA